MPAAYGSLTPHLIVSPAADAVAFYVKAFGAKPGLMMDGPGGVIMHGELKIGDSILMLADEQPPMGPGPTRKTPKNLGGTTSGVMLYVKDVDAVYARAVAAGATGVMPPMDMFWGDRYCQVEDPFGHVWAIATHVKDMTARQMKQAALTAMPPPRRPDGRRHGRARRLVAARRQRPHLLGELEHRARDGDPGGVRRRLAEPGGDDVVALAALEAHHDGEAVVGAERQERRPVGAHLVAVDRRVERRLVTVRQVVVERRRRALADRAAVLVGDAVRHRPPQVGEERAREAQLDPVQAAEDVDRDVLHDVIGVGEAVRLTGEAAPGEALERAAVAPHQDLPCRLVAPAGAHDEVHRGHGIERRRRFRHVKLLSAGQSDCDRPWQPWDGCPSPAPATFSTNATGAETLPTRRGEGPTDRSEKGTEKGDIAAAGGGYGRRRLLGRRRRRRAVRARPCARRGGAGPGRR